MSTYKDILYYHRKNSSTTRSSHGSSQKAISAKIDGGVLKDIEAERQTTGVTTNRLINMAVRWYLHELDKARREAAYSLKGKNLSFMSEDAAVKYILNLLSDHDQKRLLNIAKVKGLALELAIMDALEAYIDDYDKRPFSYL